MTREEIIEKIKKLLRMKRGGTTGEIENALAMAAKLAREHGIDLATVNPDEQAQTIKHQSDALTSRLPQEARFAAAVLVNFFNVQICVTQRRHPVRIYDRQYVLNYIGTDWEIEVARYVFQFLQKHFRRAWADRKNKRLKKRLAFLNGMFLGLCYKLANEKKDNQPSEAALMVIGRAAALREEYLKKNWPDAKDKPLDEDESDSHACRNAGWHAGRNTNIRPAVKPGASAPARAALPPTPGQMQLI